MPRRRRRPTVQQLQYRFVVETIRWWLYAFAAFMIASLVNTVPCMVGRPTLVPCEPAFPLANAVWPVLFIIGIAAGAWRYYRDYHCGDMYRDSCD